MTGHAVDVIAQRPRAKREAGVVVHCGGHPGMLFEINAPAHRGGLVAAVSLGLGERPFQIFHGHACPGRHLAHIQTVQFGQLTWKHHEVMGRPRTNQQRPRPVKEQAAARGNGLPIAGQGVRLVLPFGLDDLQRKQAHDECAGEKNHQQCDRSEPHIHQLPVLRRSGEYTIMCVTMQQTVVKQALVKVGKMAAGIRCQYHSVTTMSTKW